MSYSMTISAAPGGVYPDDQWMGISKPDFDKRGEGLSPFMVT